MSSSVLVVDPDEGRRATFRAWLDDAGFQVLACPGPQAPDFECVGVTQGYCLMAAHADVVVLNLWLESDTYLRGTPGGEVLTYYLARGIPVVLLHGWDDSVHPMAEESVVVLSRDPGRDELIGAVRRALTLPGVGRWSPLSAPAR